jgi:hypothetical protein
MSVTMEQISLVVQTLYAELIQQAVAGSGPSGSLYERKVKDSKFLYLKTTVGSSREDIYIGRVGFEQTTEKMRKRIEAANVSLKPRQELVRLLKKSGLSAPLPALAHVISALKWYGVMNSAVLVGTNAYACYPALVGYKLDAGSMGTDDVDIATVNLAIQGDREGLSLEDVLKRADRSFKPLPTLSKSALPARFRSDQGFVVDVLTQVRSRVSTETIPLPKLQAGATPLQHLAWLVEQPATAVLLSGAGLLVDIPQPARYAIHKLIVAQKRGSTDRLKRRKDLAQAASLIQALAKSDPASLGEAYESARVQGKKGWADPIKVSLRELNMKIEAA